MNQIFHKFTHSTCPGEFATPIIVTGYYNGLISISCPKVRTKTVLFIDFFLCSCPQEITFLKVARICLFYNHGKFPFPQVKVLFP